MFDWHYCYDSYHEAASYKYAINVNKYATRLCFFYFELKNIHICTEKKLIDKI